MVDSGLDESFRGWSRAVASPGGLLGPTYSSVPRVSSRPAPPAADRSGSPSIVEREALTDYGQAKALVSWMGANGTPSVFTYVLSVSDSVSVTKSVTSTLVRPVANTQ